MNFVEKYLAGEVGVKDVEKYIMAWHEGAGGDPDEEIHEFLGLTWQEYATWLESRQYYQGLEKVLGARRSMQNADKDKQRLADSLDHHEQAELGRMVREAEDVLHGLGRYGRTLGAYSTSGWFSDFLVRTREIENDLHELAKYVE